MRMSLHVCVWRLCVCMCAMHVGASLCPHVHARVLLCACMCLHVLARACAQVSLVGSLLVCLHVEGWVSAYKDE